MAPNPEGGAQLWDEGPAGNEMPNMEDDGRGKDEERSTLRPLEEIKILHCTMYVYTSK